MLSDTNKLFIRYFDLGVFDGGEIDLMINLLSKFQVDYEIYGFEANPSLAKKLITKYKKNIKVKIVPIALGNEEGEAILYLNKNLVGSSLYKDKNNVLQNKRVPVPLCKFSKWLQDNLSSEWGSEFNIIKANIEGAEWDVWQDLKTANLISNFSLWLGTKEGYDGWSLDLKKIASMKSKASKLTEEMKALGVFVYRFSSFTKRIANSDISAMVSKAIESRK